VSRRPSVGAAPAQVTGAVDGPARVTGVVDAPAGWAAGEPRAGP
jgi:hypothetical protein